MDTGGRNTPSRFMLQKLEVGTGLQGTLGSNADLTLFYFQSCKCEFLKELCHGDFPVFGQNCLKLELSTFVVHEMLIEHKEEDIK